MKRIDETVLKETQYIAVWVGLFSVLMQAVFLMLGKWDYTVLLGNLLSGTAAVLNFFLLGITVQNVLEKEDADRKNAMKVSQIYRFLFLVIVVAIGAGLPCFHIWAVMIPLFFPRIAISFRPFFDRKHS